MYQYIAIEGNIGAGKTTLSTSLAKAINAQLILEEYAENPFLPKFYKEPEKHAFSLELSFMAARFQQINNLASNRDLFKSGIVSDYFFLKSLLFASVTLKEDEYTLFKTLFNIINTNLPQPEIIIFLNTPIKQLLKNIHSRGRSYEKDISEEYLISINDTYMNYLKQISDIPILIINQNNQDYPDAQSILHVLSKPYSHGIHYLD